MAGNSVARNDAGTCNPLNTRQPLPLIDALREAFPGHDIGLSVSTASGRDIAERLQGVVDGRQCFERSSFHSQHTSFVDIDSRSLRLSPVT